jgi:hypothetical protein
MRMAVRMYFGQPFLLVFSLSYPIFLIILILGFTKVC